MKILFLGDVMGRSGRDGLARHLPTLREKLAPDAIIINVENAASGFGVNMKQAEDFFALGATTLTTGNHIWGQKELVTQIEREPRLLRPLNYPEGTPGNGAHIHTLKDGRKILTVNLLGRLFMEPVLDDPFAVATKFLANYQLGKNIDAILVDYHAEASSEKMAFAHVFDGRVSGVVGTHTHIPTADAQVLPKGTAYQTDAGMCGDYNSVIGMKAELATWKFMRKIPGERLQPAEGDSTICGSLITTDDKTGLAQSITPVRIGGRLSQT